MKIKIEKWYNTEIVLETEAESLMQALEIAVKSGANLRGADLRGRRPRGRRFLPC